MAIEQLVDALDRGAAHLVLHAHRHHAIRRLDRLKFAFSSLMSVGFAASPQIRSRSGAP
jgi:hypothetical protein